MINVTRQEPSNCGDTNFDTASLAQGIYLVKIIDGDDILIYKVVK
jgi:hypothetical protein